MNCSTVKKKKQFKQTISSKTNTQKWNVYPEVPEFYMNIEII